MWYAQNSWEILTCYGIIDGRCSCNGSHYDPKDMGKHPSLSEWNTESTSDVDIVKKWWENAPHSNIGVNCRASGFFVIDIDPRNTKDDSFERFEALVEGALPPTVEALTGAYNTQDGKVVRGRHLFYKCDFSESLSANLKKAKIDGIDIKHNGYVLISPSRHFSGVCYEWVEGKAPWQIEMAEAPEELLSVLRKRNVRSSKSLLEGDWTWVKELEIDGEKLDVERMFEDGIDEGSRAVDIFRMTCSIANKFDVSTAMGRNAVETTMIRFNAEKVRPPLDLEELLQHVNNAIDFVLKNPKTEKMWPGISDYQKSWAEKSEKETKSSQEPKPLLGVARPDDSNSVDFNNFYAGSDEQDSVFENVDDSNSIFPKDQDSLNEEDGGEPGKRSLTDTGNGRRLVDSFGHLIRYTEGLGWFYWSSGYWKPDNEKLEIQELAKNLSKYIAAEIVKYDNTDAQTNVIRWGQQAKSNARIKSAIDNANSDPRIRVPVSRWDADENLLGVLNGVIDLRTGELLKGEPNLYITRRAPVGYNKGQRNTRWQQFLDFATDGDKEYQDWIQRAVGYTLTGSRRYDVMFLVYGPPGSGKNTLVEAIVKCLGTSQYSWPMSTDVLSDSGQKNNSDQYYWAELRGKRMVWVDELPDSERLKENSVKQLTGSTEITGRSPGERPFNFESTAKLWVTTNHRPIINDDAMWRRIRPIPLLKVPEVPDPGLKEYIFDPDGALPAVLSWAVEGAIKVLGSPAKDALGWCSVVSEAAEIYRKNEDRISLFLNEETRQAEGASITMKDLYAVYRIWSEERGEKPMTQIAFHRKMVEKGVSMTEDGTRSIIHGRAKVPRAVLPGEVDWGLATRMSKF